MLRITRLLNEHGPLRLRLEGRLVGDWVHVLEGEVAGAHEPVQLTLDLSGVDFADAQAVALLRTLSARGVALVDCSPLLDVLLGGGAP